MSEQRRENPPANYPPPPTPSAAQGQGRLMDTAAIMAELGVTRAQADRIIQWCNEKGAGAIRPVDGARKLYVERRDVEAWIEASRTRSAA